MTQYNINDFKGDLVVVEGIDGCGKSTLVERLKSLSVTNPYHIAFKHYEGTAFTREPFDVEYKEIFHKMSAIEQTEWLTEDRKNHVLNTILPKSRRKAPGFRHGDISRRAQALTTIIT